MNNAVARVGGLLAVAAVPLVAGFDPGVDVSPSELVDGFHTALLWAAGLVIVGALIAWTNVRSTTLATATPDDPTPIDHRQPCYHCGSDATPLAPLTHRRTSGDG